MLKGLREWLSSTHTQVSAAREASAEVGLEAVGSLLQRFHPVGELGRGGMAVVHDVQDLGLRRRTALKVISDAFASEPMAIGQFVREAQITGQLEHPNIIPFYEFGTDHEGSHYLNMRKIEGDLLSELLPADPAERMTSTHLGTLARVMIRVCDALSYAHSRGVIHRDIKPENIIVGDFGQVYLFDWGIALLRHDLTDAPVTVDDDVLEKAAESGPVVLGTPAYMSPEMTYGEATMQDARTDVFLAGATMYKVITGRPPFVAKRAADVVALARTESAPDPQLYLGDVVLPEELKRIVMKALARDPDARYQTTADMKRDLQAFLSGASHLPTVMFSAGDTVISEGDEASTAYVIVSGRCEAYQMRDGTRVHLRELGAGDVFGEMAILTGGARTSSIEALTDLELREVSRQVLEEGLGLETAMGAFVKTLAERFAELETRVRE